MNNKIAGCRTFLFEFLTLFAFANVMHQSGLKFVFDGVNEDLKVVVFNFLMKLTPSHFITLLYLLLGSAV